MPYQNAVSSMVHQQVAVTPQLYAIADTHLSLDSDKNMEIYPGWENYMNKLTSNWRDIVTEQDTVVIAGDISWASDLCNEQKDFILLDSLPGKKILIKGNHDLWWKNIRAMNKLVAEFPSKSIEFLRNSAFPFGKYGICGATGVDKTIALQTEVVNNRNILRLENSLKEAVNQDLQPIVFLHFPPIIKDISGNIVSCEPIIDLLQKHKVKECFYGHIHGEECEKSCIGSFYNINFRLISADFVQFKPILVV
jgi:predicted phosphohydrolase